MTRLRVLGGLAAVGLVMSLSLPSATGQTPEDSTHVGTYITGGCSFLPQYDDGAGEQGDAFQIRASTLSDVDDLEFRVWSHQWPTDPPRYQLFRWSPPAVGADREWVVFVSSFGADPVLHPGIAYTPVDGDTLSVEYRVDAGPGFTDWGLMCSRVYRSSPPVQAVIDLTRIEELLDDQTDLLDDRLSHIRNLVFFVLVFMLAFYGIMMLRDGRS